MDSSVSPKDEIWFLRGWHHISNAVYSQSQLVNGTQDKFTLRRWLKTIFWKSWQKSNIWEGHLRIKIVCTNKLKADYTHVMTASIQYRITVFARVICALFSILTAEKSGCVKYADFFLWRSWSGFYSSIIDNTVRFVNILL